MTQNNDQQNPVLYAAVCLLALGIGGGIWWVIRSEGGTPLQATAPACVSANGRVWTNVVLYKDSSCSTELATVLGGKDNQVQIRYPNGSEEWKDRGGVTSQYVKSADPAIAARQWMEPSR